jgi:hypothetical protein
MILKKRSLFAKQLMKLTVLTRWSKPPPHTLATFNAHTVAGVTFVVVTVTHILTLGAKPTSCTTYTKIT